MNGASSRLGTIVAATVKVMRRRRALLYAPDDGLDR